MKQKYSSITLAPFSCSQMSINQMIKLTLICLIPHIIMLAVTSGIGSLQLLILIVLAAISSELTYNTAKGLGIKLSWSTLLQGVLIGLLLPTTYVPAAAFVITFVVLLLEKIIFTNFAQSWVNTIALTVIILYFMSPDFFPNFLLEPEHVQQTNVGMRLFSDGLLSVARYDVRITNFLNTTIFNSLGLSVPEGYITLFWDSGSPIPAFRFNALTLFVSTILFLSKTLGSLMPTIFLATYSFLVYMFSLYPYADIIGNGDILLALFTGGTMFSSFFLIGWFGTTPLTVKGKVLYGLCSGIIAFFICGAGTSSVGILFVILILNTICPLILQAETKAYIVKIKKNFELTQMARR